MWFSGHGVVEDLFDNSCISLTTCHELFNYSHEIFCDVVGRLSQYPSVHAYAPSTSFRGEALLTYLLRDVYSITSLRILYVMIMQV